MADVTFSPAGPPLATADVVVAGRAGGAPAGLPAIDWTDDRPLAERLMYPRARPEHAPTPPVVGGVQIVGTPLEVGRGGAAVIGGVVGGPMREVVLQREGAELVRTAADVAQAAENARRGQVEPVRWPVAGESPFPAAPPSLVPEPESYVPEWARPQAGGKRNG